MQLPALNELVIPGLTAFFLAFMAWREARKAKSEVINSPPASSTTSAIVSGVSMAWDRDQQERLLQLVDRMVRAQEKIALAQGVLADKQQLDMQDKLDELLERMDHMPDPHR